MSIYDNNILWEDNYNIVDDITRPNFVYRNMQEGGSLLSDLKYNEKVEHTLWLESGRTERDFINKLKRINEPDPMQIGAVFAATNMISNAIAQMPWDVKSLKGKVIPNGIYLNYLTTNMLQTRFIFVKNLIKDVLIFGNGYAYIHRDEDGLPYRLQYLAPGECTPFTNADKDEIYYLAPKIKTPYTYINKADMLHILMNSNDGLIGRGLLSFARNALILSAATEKALRDYFEHDMTIQGIIRSTTPQRLSQEQREDIRRKWRQPQDNVRVLEGGLEYQQIQSSSREAEMAQNRLFNLQEIARFFNISPVLLGDYSKMAYNTIESAQQEFLVHTLAPYVLMLEEELNRKLIFPTDRKKYYIDINEEYIITSDRTTISNMMIAQHSGGLRTTNEARSVLGLPIIDDEQCNKLIIPYTDIEQNTIGETDNSTYAKTKEEINKEEKQ